jgi:UDP-N-acetylglucosamine acyltransferase
VAIHPTAIISPGAELDPSCEIGPYAIIGPKVKMGPRCTVGAHAVIDGDTTMGADNRIFSHAAVGGIPQDLKYAGEATKLVIGDRNVFREFCTVHIGSAGGGGVTRIGNRCLIMANSHVAHDVQLGDGCILANSVALAGHVVVEDHVTFGGLSAVHQFTRVGRFAFISGGAMVTMDVPPYCTAQGDRAKLSGLNSVGLERAGFTPEQIARVKDAYRTVFRSKLGLREALSQVKAVHGAFPEVAHFLQFVEGSERGVTR